MRGAARIVTAAEAGWRNPERRDGCHWRFRRRGASGSVDRRVGETFSRSGFTVRPHASLRRRAGRPWRSRVEPSRTRRTGEACRGRTLEPGAEAWKTRARQSNRGLQLSPRHPLRAAARDCRQASRRHHEGRDEHVRGPAGQRVGGMNARTTEPLVERLTLDGETWLRYRTFPVHVGLIRGTSADRHGNLSMEREGIIGEVLPIAQAAKNHGGIVIAQVERVVERIADPKSVRVPGVLVDFVVVAEPAQHQQTFSEPFNEAYVTGYRWARHACSIAIFGAQDHRPPRPHGDTQGRHRQPGHRLARSGCRRRGGEGTAR